MAAKLLQVLSGKPGAGTVTLIDNEPSTTGWVLKGMDLGTAEYESVYSGMRGTQGAVLTGATAKNRLSSWTLEAVGITRDAALALLSQLYQLDEELRRFGGTVTFRHEHGSFKMNLRVLDSGVSHQGFDFLWEHYNRFTVNFGVVTPPYMEGETLDFSDDFSTDTEANYAVDAGSGADILVTGGALTVTANPTTEKRLVHTARGYSYGDVQVTLKPTPGSTISSFLAGVVLKWVDSSNYLRVYVDDNGTNSRLRIDKVVAGVTTNLATTNLAARVVNGVPFWVRGRIEGVNVFAEHFTAAPSPMAAPTTSTSYTLSTAEQTTFGTTIFGKVGIDWIPQQSAAVLDDFDVQAFVYRNATLPDVFTPYGQSYGDFDSLCDVEVTPSGGAAPPVWATLGWWRRPGVSNRVWNGDFESSALGSVNGWSVAAVTNMNTGGTSITGVTTAKYGRSGAQIIVPSAVTFRGATFRIFRRFRKGVTYTAEAWLHSAGAANVSMQLGNAAANDVALGSQANGATWLRRTVTWTPTADYDDAHVAVTTNTTGILTFEVDGVMVYEGAVAPTGLNQSEGRGGFPPLGIIEAENDSSAGTLAASANYRSGQGVTISGADTLDLIVDADLLVPSDYTGTDLAVEVWARCEITTTSGPLTLSARPLSAVSAAPALYTEEFGSVGKTIVRPSSGTVRRLIKLGTLRLNTDTRYILRLADAGTDTVDYLLLLPSNSRALSPSSKANDTKFPPFVNTTIEVTKRIRADLSGAYSEPGITGVAAPGLGGSLIELPIGDLEFAVKLSSLVPDDPTSDTTTEQLAHSATVHFEVTPRWRLGRSS